MNLSPSLLDTIVRSVFAGLCNLSWRVTLIAAAAAVFAVWLPAQNRSLRCAVWLTCLIAMAWVTVGTGIGSWVATWVFPSTFSDWLHADLVPLTATGRKAPIAGLAYIGQRLGAGLSTEWRWIPWFVTVLWAAGAVAMAGRFVASRASLFLLRENARAVKRTAVLDMFRDLSTQIGVRRRTVVLVSREVKAPVVVGITRPAIILPESIAEDYPMQRLAPMLIHELAHIRRRDHMVNAFQRLLAIALFFHPLYWLVCRALSTERERSCDDYVVRVTRAPRRYALSLAELAEHVAGRHPAHDATNAQSKSCRSATSQRVETLVSRKTVPPQPSAAAVAALVAVATIVAVPVSASRLVWQQKPFRPEPPPSVSTAAPVWPRSGQPGTVSFRVGDVGRWQVRAGSSPGADAAKRVGNGEGYIGDSAE